MDRSKVAYFVAILAALVILSGAAIVPMLPRAEATTTAISSDTTLAATTVNAGDTLIIDPGVTVTMSGTLTNNGNIVNSGRILLNDNVLDNYGILIDAAGGNIALGTINNYESGYITEDAGSTHVYAESFNNYGKHVTYGVFDISAYADRGIYTNFQTGTFESHDTALFSIFRNYGQATFHDGAFFRHQNSG